ncbi:MAG: GDP-mannose 4,6-dehydratase, partial [Janthinobacterium lividum]
MARTALILGTDNQDGAYLARLLLARGYQVHGVADNAAALSRLGVDGEVEQHSRADANVVDAVGADEVYDLRGPGWSRLADTRQLLGTLRGRPVRLFSAGPGADDDAVRLIDDARNDGLFAVTGRLFPHESRLGGGNSSVTRIIDAAFRGYMPAAEDLATDVDCGWAPEYVDAMWRMLQQPRPLDFTLATGRLLGGAETAGHAF